MVPTVTSEMMQSHQELQAAIVKSVELRALHAALLHNAPHASCSPAANTIAASSLRLAPAASSSPALTRISTEEYPVFTPTRQDGLRGYQNCPSDNTALCDPWAGTIIEEEPTGHGMGSFMRKIRIARARHKKTDTMSLPDDYLNSTKSSWLKAQNVGNRETRENYRSTIVLFPSSESHATPHVLPRDSSKQVFPWRFPRIRKTKQKKKEVKKKNNDQRSTPNRGADVLPWAATAGDSLELESLRKELMQANAKRAVAVADAAEVRGDLDEMKQKLIHLETYCQQMKKALKQAVQTQAKEPTLTGLNRQSSSSTRRTSTRSISGDVVRESSSSSRYHRSSKGMPVSAEVMEEGFLQVVSEARLSVKQFCRALLERVDVDDDVTGAADTDGWVVKLETILAAYGVTLSSVADPRYSREVAYHLESLLNRSLYQDFENCAFQPNGSLVDLDPLQNRRRNFSAFVSLRNLSWNEILKEGTKTNNPHCGEFAGFCDLKMGCLAELLSQSLPWPERLRDAFFVAAKCVWLTHLLAFSFAPPAGILRVGGGREFDPGYMEELRLEKCTFRRPREGKVSVKVMVVPGFYVLDRVVKCKVLCADGSLLGHG